MTESTETKPSKPGKFIIPVVVVILLIAGVGYFVATQTGLDKQMVENAVNQWGQEMQAYAKAEGKEVTFAYDAIEMAGAATDRHAIIMNPRFSVMIEDEQPEPVKLTLRTESAALYPQSVKMNAVRVHLDKPIMINADGENVGKITSEQPLNITGIRHEKEGVPYVDTQWPLPEKVTIESLKTQEVITVTATAGGNLSSSMAVGKPGLGAFATQLADLQAVDSAGQNLLSMKSLFVDVLSKKAAVTQAQPVADAQLAQPQQEQYDVTLRARIEELAGMPEEMPYGAVSVNLDADYTGPLPQENEAVDWATVPSHLMLKDFTVKTKDASLQAIADFETGSGDLLPVGTAQVKVNNFAFIRDELRRKDALNQQDEAILGALLRRMVGTGLNETENLDVALKREQGGSLHMGDLTFEEALAIVLTGGKIANNEAEIQEPGALEPGGQQQDGNPQASQPQDEQAEQPKAITEPLSE